MRRSPLLWYKVGFAVIMLLAIVLAVGLAVQAGSVKRDKVLNDAAYEVAQALNGHILDNGSIPADLKTFYKKPVPKGITYERKSAKAYRFCVEYEAASKSNFEPAFWLWSLGSTDMTGMGADETSTNYLYVEPDHPAGRDCKDITPDTLYDQPQPGLTMPAYDDIDSQYETEAKTQAAASGAQDTVCGIKGYQTHYAATITAVKTSDGKPLTPTVSQTLEVTVKPESGGTRTIQMPPNSYNVFNASCTAQTYGMLREGDHISVFQDHSDRSFGVNAMVDFSL